MEPRLNREWLEYAQARGFVTDPARVRHRRRISAGRGRREVRPGKLLRRGRVPGPGRCAVQAEDCVAGHGRGWPGAWHDPAGPAEVFAALEAPALRPAPEERYQVPYWARSKSHVDYHVRSPDALYSVPWRHAGPRVMARADEYLVKVYLRDQLIRTHPRQPPGGRSTDAADMPPGWKCMPPAPWTGWSPRPALRRGVGIYARAAAGRRRAVDDDAVGLPAGRAGRNGTARRRPRRPAPVPWTSTSSMSPRSSRCW